MSNEDREQEQLAEEQQVSVQRTTQAKLNLRPFVIPNYVVCEQPPGRRQDGFKSALLFGLSRIDPDTLDEMCKQYRASVFEEAGYDDPAGNQDCTLVAKQRDAWRAACRYIYDVISEGGKRGRPIDLISQDDYKRVVTLIDEAESLEEEGRK